MTETDIYLTGLALDVYTYHFTYHRKQVIANTEVNFVNSLYPAKRAEVFDKLLNFDIPVIFLTDHNKLDKSILDLADKKNIPVYQTSVETTKFMFLLRDFLEDYRSEERRVGKECGCR